MQFQAIVGALLLLISPAMAQFFNFGNMFGQQQQQQEPQNMGSDSQWYQQNYDGGMLLSERQLLAIISQNVL